MSAKGQKRSFVAEAASSAQSRLDRTKPRASAAASGSHAIIPVAVDLRRIRPEPARVRRGSRRHRACGYRDHGTERNASHDRPVVRPRDPATNRSPHHVDVTIDVHVSIDIAINVSVDFAIDAGSRDAASRDPGPDTAGSGSADAPSSPDINDRIFGYAEILGDGHRGALLRCPGKYEQGEHAHPQGLNYLHLRILSRSLKSRNLPVLLSNYLV